MFCVECGKEKKIYRNGVCINCYIENKTFTQGPAILDMYTCSKCLLYKYKNTWLQESFEDVLKRHIKNSFQISNELKKVRIKTDCAYKSKNVSCKVVISGFLDGHEISEQHHLKVRIKKTICNVCSKQHGGYYEATLQIRADRRKLSKNELKNIRINVENLVENLRDKGNRGLFITDTAEKHGGFDFYLSEKGPAYTIAKEIQEKFGGKIKQSSKNIGMKDSRQIYRMTYLIRLPAFRKGDFICLNNSYFYISTIHRNKVHTIRLSNWSEQVFDEKDLQKASIFGGKKLVKKMIFISQSQDELQVMDPKTYKTFEVRKPKTLSIDSNTVQIVKLEDKLFLFPEKNTINK
ncbi:MAG: 60S ribosomal export protein NMD3 [Petrotogales bacterium]